MDVWMLDVMLDIISYRDFFQIFGKVPRVPIKAHRAEAMGGLCDDVLVGSFPRQVRINAKRNRILWMKIENCWV